jgi:glycosyltransferase involved in cell wall biosynthesis
MHNPIVSVVVPTYNSADYLEPCLKSISEQSYERTELIVVDNNSQDNTKAIARQYTNLVFNKGNERSAQRNFGAKQASGQYILIIDSDMVLTKGVVQACVDAVQNNAKFKALIIPEESFGEGIWAQCKKLERSFYSGVDWQEASRFFDKTAYLEVGGYDESMTGWEDYDLPNRIESKYGADCISRVKTLIYHNERKLNLFTSCRKKFYYAKTLDLYIHKDTNQDRLNKQTSILRRYGVFFANPTKLFKNPLLGFGMLFMKTCEFAAGASGYLVGKFSQPNVIQQEKGQS